MTEILFIGSYLSKKKGSKNVTETLAENLVSDNIFLRLSSRLENKFFRIADIVWQLMIFRGKKVQIDVYSGPAFQIASIASLLAFLRNKEIILALHGGKLTEFEVNNANRIAKVFNRAKYIQTPSNFLKDYFTKKGFLIHYLPNAVNLEKFPYKNDIVNDNKLLWVRAFTSIYNPEFAIKVLFEVQKKYPLCTLTMIGPDNGLLLRTTNLVSDLGLTEHVTFTGAIPNEELFTYYQSHSVFLNTTSYESFGVAVVEAAACGIPVVSNKVGEIPYIWQDEKNILMVEDLNASDFANQIFKLWENDELRLKISLAARKNAESFSWEKIKPFWIKLLSEKI